MMPCSRIFLALFALAALGLATARPAVAQGLNGQPLTTAQAVGGTSGATSVYYPFAGTGTVTPAGTTFSRFPLYYVFVTPTQIQFAAYAAGGDESFPESNDLFNGFRVSEIGYSPATITGVSVDPATNVAGFDSNRVAYDGTDIYANFANLNLDVGQNVTLDVVTGSAAVPEASTTVSFGLLLALGLGGAVVAARKKKAAV